MRLKKIAAVAALSAVFSGFAAAETPSYDYVQLGYSAGEYADLEVFDLGGFEVEGSYEIGNNLFVTGKYRDADDSAQGFTFDETYWQAGIGYRFNYRSDLVFDARLYYNQVDFDLHDSEDYLSADANFFSVAGNARYQVLEDVEVYGGVEWQRWPEGGYQTGIRGGVQYAFGKSNEFAVGIEYSHFSDSEWCKLFARYSF